MRVAALVVHFRNWPEVADTITDVLDQGVTDLVVLDNASGDGSAAALREAFPDVRVVESPVNGGYAAGVNAGLRAVGSGSDAILVLSHEVRLAPGAVDALAGRLREAPRVGAVGPLVGHLDRPDEVWSAGGLVDPRSWNLSHRLAGAPMSSVPPGPAEVDWLDGCAMLLRSSAVEPLDEAYVSYVVEVDQFHRMRRRGWTVECVPDARAWQRPGSVPLALWERNKLRFVWRHAKPWDFARVLRGEYRQIRRDGETEKMRGLRAFLTGRMP